MTTQEYYEGDTLGSYQYTTLESVINDYLMSRGTDDFTSDTPRSQVLYQAMSGLRELYFDVLQEISGISRDLSPSLQIELPPDYINYVRISYVDGEGMLHVMAMDNRINIAVDYLQDSDYKLLFDDSGCVLKGTGGSQKPISGAEVSPEAGYSYTFCDSSFKPNKDMSTVYSNGKYRIDKAAGIIQFGSGVEGRTIVLEYLSDGLYAGCDGKSEGEIRVNKFAQTALLDGIYYQLIKNRRNVPANEKQRARKEYYNSKRIAKARINTLRKDELMQYFKASTKWIK